MRRSAARTVSLGIPIVLTLAFAAPVPSANAGFVSALEDSSSPFEPPTMNVTYGDPSDPLPDMDGERNTVEIFVANGKLVVRDTSAGVQGADCEQNGPNEQLCPIPDRLDVRLGKLDDSLSVTALGHATVLAFGGEGDDELTLDPIGSRFVGGPGADTMTGGPGQQFVSYDEKTAPVEVDLTRATGQGTSGEDDEIRGIEDVFGGQDDDRIIGDGGANRLGGGFGEDQVSGGDGDDTVVNSLSSDGADDLDGGAGHDTLDYSARRDAGVTVDLRQASGQGAAGENDSVAAFEGVRGSPFADTLIGDSGPNTLDGDIGGDLLQGGLGDDLLLPGWVPPNPSWGGGHLGDADGADESDGGPGVDTVDYGGRWYAVTIDLSTVSGQGESGEGDRILAVEQALGGGGDDTLRGNDGVNLLDGRTGADTIESRDGAADSVLCGDGPDTARVDSLDQTTECETVDRRDPPRPAGGSAPQATDSTAPVLLFAASNRNVRVSRRGVVAFLLGPFDEDVDGALALRARKPFVAARRVARLAATRFTGESGRTTKVRLRLRPRALKRLKHVRAVRATAKVSLRDAAGNITSRSYPVRLLAPRRPARQR